MTTTSTIPIADYYKPDFSFAQSFKIEDLPTFKLINNKKKNFEDFYIHIQQKINTQQIKSVEKTIILPPFNEIQSNATIIGIPIKNINSYYNNLYEKIFIFLQNVNEYITKLVKKYTETKIEGKKLITVATNTIHKANNQRLLILLKKLRRDQPQCFLSSFKIPKFLKPTSLDKNFIGITNSIFVNYKIYVDIIECYNTLKKIMTETITIAIGGSTNFNLVKNVVEDCYKEEFKNTFTELKSQSQYDTEHLRGYGTFGRRFGGRRLSSASSLNKKTKKKIQFKSLSKSNSKSNTKSKTKRKLKMHSKFHKKTNSC
jgi:hypothetical protein